MSLTEPPNPRPDSAASSVDRRPRRLTIKAEPLLRPAYYERLAKVCPDINGLRQAFWDSLLATCGGLLLLLRPADSFRYLRTAFQSCIGMVLGRAQSEPRTTHLSSEALARVAGLLEFLPYLRCQRGLEFVKMLLAVSGYNFEGRRLGRAVEDWWLDRHLPLNALWTVLEPFAANSRENFKLALARIEFELRLKLRDLPVPRLLVFATTDYHAFRLWLEELICPEASTLFEVRRHDELVNGDDLITLLMVEDSMAMDPDPGAQLCCDVTRWTQLLAPLDRVLEDMSAGQRVDGTALDVFGHMLDGLESLQAGLPQTKSVVYGSQVAAVRDVLPAVISELRAVHYEIKDNDLKVAAEPQAYRARIHQSVGPLRRAAEVE